MPKVFQLYRLLNVLSLDVVAGAFVCALFFARIFSVRVTPYGLIALCLTVWIIYTTDHLWDAKKINQQASTERHRFHQRHFNTIMNILVGLIILDAITILFLRQQVLGWGIALSLAVALYLITHRLLRFLKEIFIAIMYTCGILLPSLPVTSIDINATHFILIIQFSILALINLLMFSWFDRELDQRNKQHSFVTLIGDQAARIGIWLLIVLEVSLTLVHLLSGDLKVPALVLGIMGIVLLMIFVFREKLASHDYYRFLGDAVFILPLFYLI